MTGAAHPSAVERRQRLKDAVEGECDGLAISDEQAIEILAYLDTGLPPDERPRTSGWVRVVPPPAPTTLQWEDEPNPPAPTLVEALGRLRASIAWLRDGVPAARGIGVADMVVIEAAIAAHQSRLGEYNLALGLLCGLHPEITRDEPTEVAQQIFDHVQAEREDHARERKNAQDTIELLLQQRATQPRGL